ncbi:MAG: hypothetical protein AABZ53_02580, partial [Planctomycetota bacterium]
MNSFSRLAVRFVVLALACLASPFALAQTAPDGNAHPEAQAVTRSDVRLSNPFGVAPRDAERTTIAQKAALAAGVDLSPLRDLAVQHSGRVKIMDTLARETVSSLTGQHAYTDLLPEGDKLKKVKYDPLFSLLDLIIEPRYYLDKPLLGIDYLPLRRMFVEAQFPGDKAAQKRELKLLRISPTTVVTFAEQIMTQTNGSEPFLRAIGQINQSLALWRDSADNLVLVAPASSNEAWTHLSLLPSDHPARKAALDLGSAWRARDVAAINAAVKVLASELPRINAELYPTTARTLETTYNRVHAFEWGFYAYFLSLITLLLAFGTGRSWLAWLGS